MKRKYKILVPTNLKSLLAREYYKTKMLEFLNESDALTPKEINEKRNTLYRDALGIRDEFSSLEVYQFLDRR